ncbi:MAG: nitronate monooxygenase [Armatimonadetes bacterium CG_4_10_14_3_um_filter_66_18]|nr:MAG: 2-nitropropane dioxygenase [Armatimonadetes bacterium CG2_30_66_41]PIX42955.1 MAG: nitronate monooxygenase [Armatimonadetes bacterium CG_4_8_14_3_um_filter_66_20]PIY49422.1 MAG: nitronate monooxygenase [Armatimonadetes bacterium CG_4_10_14_3_um_filter_66_18]
MATSLPDLKIGELTINPPIVQGGMGVRVSGSSLASAVSNEGALGVIASVGVGEEWPDQSLDYPTRSALGFREMIRQTMDATPNPIGVNIMCVLTNYESLVRVADEEGVAAIISGAGLPLKLPGLVKNPKVKLIPIVSSGRAAEVICKSWAKKHGRLPDAVVVEGPLAGGHLGFSREQVDKPEEHRVERLVAKVAAVVGSYGQAGNVEIPVIAAGGVYDGTDIARFLKLGAAGVQMATRFVCTHECDAALAYKETYLRCTEEDVVVINSPVGLPGRVVRNEFVERVLRGERVPFRCAYHCLATCNPKTAPYCIAAALINAYRGNLDAGFAMCGTNAARVDEIVSVRELIDELVEETARAL